MKISQPPNLLPYDGNVSYHPGLLSPETAHSCFELLLNRLTWKNDEVIIFGKRIVTSRKTAWYGDAGYRYTYSKTTKVALPWTPELLDIKRKVEEKSAHRFNCCLANLYHDGSEGMSWHSDDEPMLVRGAAIASVSLGAERKFSFKHKTTKESFSTILQNGSLLVMEDPTQKYWKHALPKSKRVTQPRINLTFRRFV